MKLSILIPAYNEEKMVGEVLKRVLALPLKKEVIVVDNGSVDGTGRIIKKFASNPELVPMRIEKNVGKGHAIREAMAKATGDVIVIQDADLEYPPEEIPKMLKEIRSGADAVYGSRFKGKINGMSLTNRIGNLGLSLATRLLYNVDISDVETGYKMFRRGVVDWRKLRADNFEIEPEITAQIVRSGRSIREIPIDYFARPTGEKKIRMKDGFIALKWLVKCRFE